MPRTLTPQYVGDTIDWNGRIINRQMIDHLFPSCIVRIAVNNEKNGCGELIYFKITKIKDGTFWGVSQETYRLFDWIKMDDGAQMTFRREHINEIPLDWQPKQFRKSVRKLEGLIKDQGYLVTGAR